MRTSRGLQVTSLVVLSPVVLILLSLLTILTTTLFSQLQLWYPSLYCSSPSLSKWVSTATATTTTTTTFGHSSNDSLFLQTDDTNTTSYFSTSNIPNTNSSYYRPPSMIHIWLKRWRHSKRKSPSLWTMCGLALLLGYVYLHKSHVQKRQASRFLFKLATFLTRGLGSVAACCGKQTMVLWKDHLSGEKQLDTMNVEDILSMDNDNNTKQKEQNTRTTATHHQRHNTKKMKKQQRQRSSSLKHTLEPSSHNNNKQQQQQQHSSPRVLQTTTAEDVHVESNDWISVGDNKKKKDGVQPPPPSTNLDHSNDHEDYDDDDKTMVDELDTTTLKSTLMETPTTSDDDESESLGSPLLVNNNNSSNNNNSHHYEPVIRNWYSPFSTGLDLDILPREDPLVMLDPMQLRKYDDRYYQNNNNMTCKMEPRYQPCDNFSLLQNHPFIINEQQRLRQQQQQHYHHHQTQPLASSPPLGAIGQNSPPTSSSPVQNSTRHPFSLFI